MTRYYKVLNRDGSTLYGGSYRYDLPRWDAKQNRWVPGKWTARVAPKICKSGYHVTDADHLIEFLHYGPMICVAEVRGATDTGTDKIAAESIRLTEVLPWDDVSARLFAVECAAEVLPRFEAACPNAPSVADCLSVAYQYALGDATANELSAARSAAWGAAWNAARNAARNAAWNAASAARSAAWNAESAALQKQTARLIFWIGETNAYPED